MPDAITPAVPSRIDPIVALDVPDRAGAERVVRQLGEACGYYKVGLELLAAAGPSVVRWLRAARSLDSRPASTDPAVRLAQVADRIALV